MRNKTGNNTEWQLRAAANELFGRQVGSKSNVRLPVGGGGFEGRAIGFRLAADTVIAHSHGMVHVEVFPVCYLYRHYLELRIKQLTSLAKIVLNEEGSYSTGHKLRDLWKECQLVLKKVIKRRTKDFNTVGKCIDAFASFDSDGEYFRYPEDTVGRVWEQSIEGLNLRKMRDAVSGVASLMDTFYDEMDNVLECRALRTP